jgi:N-acetylglucosaminyl-diphospho-decaprenol L-rhamnosyltransferase
MTPTARIVIVNYNGGDFIHTAVESATSQTVACDVVVVDNASTDGSPETIARTFPQARLLSTGANLGFANAANVGAFDRSSPRPPYVAFLNPDAHAVPEWIERTTQWMERENVDIASSVVSGIPGEAFFAGGRWLPWVGATIPRRAYAGVATDWVSGCAMVARFDAFAALSGFDSEYFLYSEDVDLSLRARRAGMRLGVYGETLVAHPEEGRSTGRNGRLFKHRISYIAKGRIMRRFAGPWLPSALLFQLLVSPGLNGWTPREYPVLMKSMLRGVFVEKSAYKPQ